MKKYFCASDIHSFFDVWHNALVEKGFDDNNPDHICIVCGDLFDRGDQTVETYEFAKMLSEQDRLVYITGNHEDLLFDCLKEISCGKTPSLHHFSNGTVKTICHFCGVNTDRIMYDPSLKNTILSTMQPVIDFITNNCVDFAELGNNIFVHGWVPCYQGLDDFRLASSEDWERARWDNGMEMWSYPRCRVEDKTVVCGHWHCSWGWSHLKQKRKEFPPKNRADFAKSFEPFSETGILAIDACVAYSGICNVVVFDEEGNKID